MPNDFIGIRDLAFDYFDRCISAINLYVKVYNDSMKEQIELNNLLPLGKEFKKDRFKSMTGDEWKEEYEGHMRKYKEGTLRIQGMEGDEIFFERPIKEE